MTCFLLIFLENCVQCIYKLLLKFLLSGLHAPSQGTEGLYHDTEQPGSHPQGQMHTPLSRLLQHLPPPPEAGGPGAPTTTYTKP